MSGADGGIALALEWAQLNTIRASFKEIERHGRRVFYHESPGGGAPAVRFDRTMPFVRQHSFTTLDGLVGYLTSAHCEGDKGVVFVEEHRVMVSLRYGTLDIDPWVILPLGWSDEYGALERLFAGVGQQELWESLVGALYDCVDDGLLNSISSLRLNRKRMGNSDIDSVGIVSGSSGESVTLRSAAKKDSDPDQDVEIDLRWDFTVRLWEAFPREYTIPTRLVVKDMKEKGVLFKFVPRRLEELRRDARLDLAKEIRDRLQIDGDSGGTFSVFEGSL